MALIKCKSCGHVMSDRADFCPHCGCPKEFSIKEETSITEETPAKEMTSIKTQELFQRLKSSMTMIMKQQTYKIFTKKINQIKDWSLWLLHLQLSQ